MARIGWLMMVNDGINNNDDSDKPTNPTMGPSPRCHAQRFAGGPASVHASGSSAQSMIALCAIPGSDFGIWIYMVQLR